MDPLTRTPFKLPPQSLSKIEPSEHSQGTTLNFKRLTKPFNALFEYIKSSFDQDPLPQHNGKWVPLVQIEMVAAVALAALGATCLAYKAFQPITEIQIPFVPPITPLPPPPVVPAEVKTMNLTHAVILIVVLVAGILLKISHPKELLRLPFLTPIKKNPIPINSPIATPQTPYEESNFNSKQEPHTPYKSPYSLSLEKSSSNSQPIQIPMRPNFDDDENSDDESSTETKDRNISLSDPSSENIVNSILTKIDEESTEEELECNKLETESQIISESEKRLCY